MARTLPPDLARGLLAASAALRGPAPKHRLGDRCGGRGLAGAGRGGGGARRAGAAAGQHAGGGGGGAVRGALGGPHVGHARHAAPDPGGGRALDGRAAGADRAAQERAADRGAGRRAPRRSPPPCAPPSPTVRSPAASSPTRSAGPSRCRTTRRTSARRSGGAEGRLTRRGSPTRCGSASSCQITRGAARTVRGFVLFDDWLGPAPDALGPGRRAGPPPRARASALRAGGLRGLVRVADARGAAGLRGARAGGGRGAGAHRASSRAGSSPRRRTCGCCRGSTAGCSATATAR